MPLVPVRPQIDTLKNGVRVVTASMPHHARCHIFVQLRGGPAHEDDQTWGLSHVLEHMVFRGTARHADSRAVGLAADDFGGDLGAATYRDRVTFDTRCDPDRIADALALLGEMLTSPRFEGLTTELSIIEEEIAELYDDDGQEIDVDNVSFRQVFAGDVLARSIEGAPASLKKVTRHTLEQFHARVYGGPNIVVSVAGPVEHSEVLAAARKHLRKVPASVGSLAGTPQKTHRPHIDDVVVVRTDDGQTSLRLCARIPGFKDLRGAAVVSVLGRVLDDGPASRVQQEIIDRDGLAYSAWAMADPYERAGVLELGGQVRHDRVLALVEAFVAQLTALTEKAPAKAELARVVRRLTRDARDLQDDPAALAEACGRAVLFGELFDLQAQVERAASVQPREVSELASRARAGLKLALVGLPKKKHVVAARAALAAHR